MSPSVEVQTNQGGCSSPHRDICRLGSVQGAGLFPLGFRKRPSCDKEVSISSRRYWSPLRVFLSVRPIIVDANVHLLARVAHIIMGSMSKCVHACFPQLAENLQSTDICRPHMWSTPKIHVCVFVLFLMEGACDDGGMTGTARRRLGRSNNRISAAPCTALSPAAEASATRVHERLNMSRSRYS